MAKAKLRLWRLPAPGVVPASLAREPGRALWTAAELLVLAPLAPAGVSR
jgi:hypothetical protein